MSGWDYEGTMPPMSDTRVDRLDSAPSGEIDSVPSLTLDISDREIIKNLEGRIEDSRSYWDQPEGFNLRESRNENMRLFLGKQIDVTQLYRFQVPYVENEIFVSIEAIVSYLTTSSPQPEVYPAQDTPQSKTIATDLEKALMAHSQKFQLNRIFEICVRNLLLKRVGIIYLSFDPDYGDNGEIIPQAIDPDHIIVDKNAIFGGNPAFVCHLLKFSAEELCYRYPKKKKEIMDALGMIRSTPKQMSQEVAVRRVWITHYDKTGKPQEGCVTYFGDLVLSKYKNANFLYARGRNFLDMPLKPFIFLNYINDGQHMIDLTTPVEQAGPIQNILNKRGRQIMENADKANGLLVISTDSGLSKDDAMNLTGDPNQKILIKTAGQPVGNLVYQVPPHSLPSYVMDDKLDLRTTIHNIMGTPNEFTGNDSEQSGGEKTLGQSMITKNQASGRQDLIARAVDSFADSYYKYLTQMMLVWYTEKHYFVYNGGNGEFDYITMHRNFIEDGIAVSVKSGTTLPFDKQRQEAVAMNLGKLGLIDPYNMYRDLHMDQPQKRYDAWFKWKTDPGSLARDVDNATAESQAYVDFIELLAGKDVPPHDDATTEHVLTHRKQMLTDKFLKAPRNIQNKFLTHLEKELQSLELRTDLDEMSEQGGPQALAPNVPIQPPMQPGMGGMPGQPPQPGMMPQPGMGAPMPGQPQPMPQGMPMPPPMGMPQGPGIMQGAGMIDPANPRVQGPQNLTALPAL